MLEETKMNHTLQGPAPSGRMPEIVPSRLYRLFYAFFALAFSWMSVHIAVRGYYDYREVRLLLCTLGVLALLVLVWRLINRHEAALARRGKVVTAVFLALMCAAQMLMSLHLRYQPVWDVDAIYGGAIQWVETGTFSSYYEYYSYFFNNFGGLRFLYAVFRIARWVGFQDYFMAATIANCALSLATMYTTGAVARELMGVRGQIMAYALFAVSPPFYFIAPAFYTDALSMLFPVLTYWLYLLARKQARLPVRIALYVLMGVVAAIGIRIKPTVGIVLVAIGISAFFTWNWKRALCMALVVLLIVAASQANLESTIYQHLDRETAQRMRTPILHWVMMGLAGSGAYNSQDYAFTRSFEDLAERDAALKQRILERIQALGPSGIVHLFTRKSDICFGDGTYGLSDCLGGRRERDTFLHSFLLSEGEHYELYRHLCMGALLAMYLLMIVSAIQEVFRADSPSLYQITPRLAVFGLLLFLLWWEARWRYFSNYIPMIFLSALLGMDAFSRATELAGKRLLRAWRTAPRKMSKMI